MNENKVILLTGSRIAIPVLRDLFYSKQLAAIVVPERSVEFIEQVQPLLTNSDAPVIIVNAENFPGKIQEAIKLHKPAIGIVFGFSFKIPAAVYTMPAKGFYNIHPGPLPAYRGPDPVFRQVKNREPYAAVTIHKIDDGFDSGAIVLSDKIRLSVTDTHGLLTTKLSELAAIMIGTLLKMAAFDMQIPSRPQDISKAHYFKRQAAAEITVNWQTMHAAEIIALINACNPWNKGAVTKLNNNIIRLLDAYKGAAAANNNPPGTILSVDEKGITVALVDNESIIITLIYCEEGFLPVSRLKDFAVTPGLRFESF